MILSLCLCLCPKIISTGGGSVWTVMVLSVCVCSPRPIQWCHSRHVKPSPSTVGGRGPCSQHRKAGGTRFCDYEKKDDGGTKLRHKTCNVWMVTHHSHQKDALGLEGEVSCTPKRHWADSRTVLGLGAGRQLSTVSRVSTAIDSYRQYRQCYCVGTRESCLDSIDSYRQYRQFEGSTVYRQLSTVRQYVSTVSTVSTARAQSRGSHWVGC